MALLKRFLVQKKKQTCKLLKSFLSVFPILVILSSSSILWFIFLALIHFLLSCPSLGLPVWALPYLGHIIITIIINYYYHYYQLSLLLPIIIITIINYHYYQSSLSLSLLPSIIISITNHYYHYCQLSLSVSSYMQSIIRVERGKANYIFDGFIIFILLFHIIIRKDTILQEREKKTI